MENLFGPGFLGTRAPLFVDLATLALLLLPPAFGGGIFAARRGYYGVHRGIQWALLVCALAVTIWFGYGIYLEGGFRRIPQEISAVSIGIVTVVAIHLLIAFLSIPALVEGIECSGCSIVVATIKDADMRSGIGGVDPEIIGEDIRV
jgi:putative membrane protein